MIPITDLPHPANAPYGAHRAPRHLAPPAPVGREATIMEATRLITNLMRCVLWLIKHGVYVTGFSAWRGACIDRVVVTVAASPYLYILFGRDGCAWRERRQDGALVIHTWFGERFGVRVEWQEVTCG